MNISRSSLAASVLAHSAIIAFIVLGSISFKGANISGGGGGSGGDFVTVWIEGPSGRVAAVGVSKARSEMKMGLKSPAEPAYSKSTGSGKKSMGSGEGSGGKNGNGTGQGEGIGAGTGTDDDETLSKIWKKIDRSKFYPSVARMKRLEGSPKVKFEITNEGGVVNVTLSSSCGEKILDDAAVETIRRAAPLPYYSRPITLAVNYSVE